MRTTTKWKKDTETCTQSQTRVRKYERTNEGTHTYITYSYLN